MLGVVDVKVTGRPELARRRCREWRLEHRVGARARERDGLARRNGRGDGVREGRSQPGADRVRRRDGEPYDVPLVRPVTFATVTPPPTDAVLPPGVEVTV